jgi:hypothetical protein
MRDHAELYAHQDTEAIYVPASLQTSILQWYRTTLQHPGIKRMQATLKEFFYWPGVDAAVESLVRTCATCQKCKLTVMKKYGKTPLPAKTNSTLGRKSMLISSAHGTLGTGWPEFFAIRNKTSYHIALLFDSEWLCCYPRPARVVYDNENEFVGQEFQELLESYGIKPVATTIRNPKSNGVVERVHLTMGDMLWTMTFSGSDWFTDMQVHWTPLHGQVAPPSTPISNTRPVT